jgi:hypothetical protein
VSIDADKLNRDIKLLGRVSHFLSTVFLVEVVSLAIVPLVTSLIQGWNGDLSHVPNGGRTVLLWYVSPGGGLFVFAVTAVLWLMTSLVRAELVLDRFERVVGSLDTASEQSPDESLSSD